MPQREVQSIRMEFKQGTSNKFYELRILLDADSYTLRATWGRVGTRGCYQDKANGSLSVCERAWRKLIDEKVSRGYKSVRPAVMEPVVPSLKEANKRPRQPIYTGPRSGTQRIAPEVREPAAPPAPKEDPVLAPSGRRFKLD